MWKWSAICWFLLLLIIETKSTQETTPKTTITSTLPAEEAKVEKAIIAQAPIKTNPKCKPARIRKASEIYFFGARSDRKSFIRFNVDPEVYEKNATYVFLFYSLVKNGLLLNTLTAGKFDYESVYLQEGYLYYLFNAGSGNLLIKSKKLLNDGKWHTVQAIRDYKDGKLTGKLIVDGETHAEGEAPGTALLINRLRKVYMGGFPSEVSLPTIIPFNQRFVGGMGVISPPGKENLSPPDALENITPGFVSGLSPGISIGHEGGYFYSNALGEIGKDFTLSMNVRSNRRGGLLFHAKKEEEDGLTIIIGKAGELTARCDNGKGEFSVTVVPDEDICDGKFHRVFLRKVSTMMFLAVDEKMDKAEAEHSHTHTSANTFGEPFYFGGIPDILQPKGYEKFAGCISKIRVRNEFVDEADLTASGHAIHGCAKL